MLESKQQLAEKHWSLEMPGKPQFNLFLVLTREHWQGSAERPWLSQPPTPAPSPRAHPGSPSSATPTLGKAVLSWSYLNQPVSFRGTDRA